MEKIKQADEIPNDGVLIRVTESRVKVINTTYTRKKKWIKRVLRYSSLLKDEIEPRKKAQLY